MRTHTTLPFISGLCLASALSLGSTLVANAQLSRTETQILRTTTGFLNTGGYFFTNSSAALGSPKFYRAGGFYAKPKHYGAFALTGGIESVSASDHFFPFTGGNEFSLTGPSARLSANFAGGRIQPFITAGLYAGRVRSVNLNFDRTQFTPGGSVGVVIPLGKFFSLQASYRVSQKINGVNTDGFGIDVKLF